MGEFGKHSGLLVLILMVLDRGITMESGWDFFLQAHDSLKGTAKPAHYVVLRNDFKEMKPKDLENIVSSLCFLHCR